MKKLGSLLFVAFLLVSLCAFYMKANAQTTIVMISPSSKTVLKGESFWINVTVADVTDLCAWELKIYYLSSVLNGSDLVEGPFLAGVRDTFFWIVNFTDNYNATHGRIWAVCTLKSSGAGASGSGVILSVKFYAKEAGSTSLYLTDTILVNSAAQVIPHAATSGTVKVIKPPTADFTYTPAAPIVDEIITFNASTSSADGGYITAYTWDFGDGNITTVSDPIIKHSYPSAGKYNVTLTIMDSEGLTDSTWREIIVTEVRYHNIAVISLSSNFNAVYPGWIVQINVTVQNRGNFTEAFSLTIYANETAIHTENVYGLIPSETRMISINWNTTGLSPCQNFTLKAQAEILPDETETADNTLTDGTVKVKMPGDVNGDGKVDYKDLFSLAAAYGAPEGDPRYNVNTDFNLDRKVNYKDLFTLAANYGKSCS